MYNILSYKLLFVHLRLEPYTIADYYFISQFANLVLSSSCTIDSLLHSRSSLHSSDFKSLCIHPYIYRETIVRLVVFYFMPPKYVSLI